MAADRFDSSRYAHAATRFAHQPVDAPGAYGATMQPKVVPSAPSDQSDSDDGDSD